MRQDILTKAVINRQQGGTVTYKMERGTAGELLFLISGGSWNYKDIISAKLRHGAGEVTVVIDRMPALLLAWLCDLKKGRPSVGTQNTAGEAGEEQVNETTINAGQPFFVNAFKVLLGHISLSDAASELEITVEFAKAFGSNVGFKLANVEPASSPDYVLCYDKSNDLESTHVMVREMYVYGKNGVSLFNAVGGSGQVAGKNIDVMLYSEGGAYETDIEVLGANTSIDSELSHSVSNLVCAFQDLEGLPTPSLRVKVTGDDTAVCGLFFIKERMLQALTSVSTIAQVDKLLQKTEAIERMDPTAAKAYRHAGVTQSSESLADIKTAVVAKTPEAR